MRLKYTLDEVRERELAQVGKVGHPNPWWAWAGGSDCMAAQSWLLGLRDSRTDSTPHLISIAAFQDHYGWDRPGMDDVRAGDLVAENWLGSGGGRTPEHVEYVYSIDRAAGEITTCSANTGPVAGDDERKRIGFWRKTRPVSKHFLHGIRPPYRDAKPSRARRAVVKFLAAYLNPDIANKTNLPGTRADEDGIEGPNYWRLVQAWGRREKVYGPTYRIDGIPGPRSREVEATLYETLRKAK